MSRATKLSPWQAKAVRLADLYEIEKRAEKERREITAEILENLRREGNRLELPDGRMVCVMQSSQKRPTKTILIEILGNETAEAAWAKIPETLSEYVTVKGCEI